MASSGKQAKCGTCGQTGDSPEMVEVKRKTYHKSCFKCFHEGCTDISRTNCAEIDGTWYCDRHFYENINRHLFGGVEGQCFICGKAIYLPEKLIANGLNFHRACFKCCHGCPLQVSNYRMFEGALYCNEHKKELDMGDCTRIYNLPELIKKGIFKLEPARGRGPSSSGPKS